MLVLLHSSLGICLLLLVSTSTFLGTGWCQALARPKNFCLEKVEGIREAKAWRNEVTTGDNKCDEGVLGPKYQSWKNNGVEGTLFRAPSKALGSASKYLRTRQILPRGSYQGQVVELNGPCGFTWCCHSYILQWFKFLNIWLLAKFAQNVKPAESSNVVIWELSTKQTLEGGMHLRKGGQGGRP